MAHGLNSIIIKREIEISNESHNHNHHHSLLHSQHHYLEQQHFGIMTPSTNLNASAAAAPSSSSSTQQHHHPATATKMGSRRIFTPLFKLQVLDSYRNDSDCKGNQRATARKYGIHRRQIQKWLQCEQNLRTSVTNGGSSSSNKLSTTNISNEMKNCQHANTLLSHHQQIDIINAMPFDVATTASAATSLNRQSPAAPVCYEPVIAPTVAQSPLSLHSSSSPPPPPPVFPTHHHQNTYDYPPFNLVAASPYPSSGEIYHQQQQYVNSAAAATYYENYYILPPHLNISHSPAFASAPIDLSLHTRGRSQRCESRTLSPAKLCQPPSTSSPSTTTTIVEPTSPNTNADVWDLSAATSRKRKPTDATAPETPPKVARLFRPFLDDDDDEDAADGKTQKFNKHADPIIWSNYTTSVGSPPYSDMNNNFVYTSLPSPGYETMQSYSNMVAPQPTLQPATTCPHFFSYGSPVSGYDTASSYSSSSECGDSIPPRNCSSADSGYSVDFKIQAIDSYYNECRGNKEAVADKFSVHQRQIQRWLLQEDDLRRSGTTN